MPKFNSSVLGAWIQIAASVGVIAGITLLIGHQALTRGPIQSDPIDPVVNSTPETRPVYLQESPVTEARQSELRDFVERNCPSCHGTQIAGSIGPALLKADLEHLSVNAVTFTILYGRPAKGMPAWETQLSRKDAYWIAEQLKQEDIMLPAG